MPNYSCGFTVWKKSKKQEIVDRPGLFFPYFYKLFFTYCPYLSHLLLILPDFTRNNQK